MEQFGFSHFLAQADVVGLFVLFALLAMSLASWTLILIKLVQLRVASRNRRTFLDGYLRLSTPAGLQPWLR
jgi:biopolymer transport protein ExbB/TolQ